MAEAGITLEIATARVTMYLAAEAAVLDGQEYRLGDRQLTRADLREVREGLVFWQGQVAAFGGTTPRPRGRVRRGSYRCR